MIVLARVGVDVVIVRHFVVTVAKARFLRKFRG